MFGHLLRPVGDGPLAQFDVGIDSGNSCLVLGAVAQPAGFLEAVPAQLDGVEPKQDAVDKRSCRNSTGLPSLQRTSRASTRKTGLKTMIPAKDKIKSNPLFINLLYIQLPYYADNPFHIFLCIFDIAGQAHSAIEDVLRHAFPIFA